MGCCSLAAVVELPDLLETVVQELVLDHVLVLPIGLAVVADAGALIGPDAHGDVEPLLSHERGLLVLEGAVHQGLHLGHVVHEHAAHEELRVVVVAFHEAVAGIAVPGSATVGHQRGGTWSSSPARITWVKPSLKYWSARKSLTWS